MCIYVFSCYCVVRGLRLRFRFHFGQEPDLGHDHASGEGVFSYCCYSKYSAAVSQSLGDERSLYMLGSASVQESADKGDADKKRIFHAVILPICI